MKVRVWLVACLTVVISLVGGWWLIGSKGTMPDVTIESGSTSVESVLGSYCWSGLTQAACVDTAAPPELVKKPAIEATVVKPGATVSFEFTKKPTTWAVSIWNDNESDEVPLQGNAFQVPHKKGRYVFDVSAHWDRGDAIFAFVIDVQ